MYDQILNYLKSYKNTKISLGQFEAMADPNMPYTTFQHTLQTLLDNQILLPVHQHGTNGKNPPLPLTFRIQKSVISSPLKQEIKHAQLRFHQSIRLDPYFRFSESRWNADLTFLEKVNDYLNHYGFPQEEATGPERSFHLVGDEKWIDEKGGNKLLERIGVWNLLKISAMPDPLMFAVHLQQLQERHETYRHLIVENKTTYYAILPILRTLPYATLIYGAGWKVVSGINGLRDQLGLTEDVLHQFEYFGDLDHEGLAIWHGLYQKCKAVPTALLYRGLLQQEPSVGKEGQRIKKEAIEIFTTFFTEEERVLIATLLEKGEYVPQEAISAELLRDKLLQLEIISKEGEDIGP